MSELIPIAETAGAEATGDLATRLGRLLGPGDVVGLCGELGAGKTCFAQGLAVGLDVSADEYVRSPTFSLVNLHAGRCPFYHVDLYRLEEADEATFIGYDDLFDGSSVVAIEWFDRFPSLWPADCLIVVLRAQPGGSRLILAQAMGERAAELLRAWQAEAA